jgi:hypothetical protein
MRQPFFGDEEVAGRDELGIRADPGNLNVFGTFDANSGNVFEYFF